MEFELMPDMHARLSGLAERRGWTIEELVGSYIGVAADVDEAGEADLVSEDERALLIAGLMALGLPEGWTLIEKLENRALLWLRQSG